MQIALEARKHEVLTFQTTYFQASFIYNNLQRHMT